MNTDIRDETLRKKALKERTAEPQPCEVTGCCEPATEKIYDKRVCRKHLTLWSA